jgi:hypothetical protein
LRNRGIHLVIILGSLLVFMLVSAVPALANIVPLDDTIADAQVRYSPHDDDLTLVTDTDDVIKVELSKDQTITISLTSTSAADFDLYLYGPGTTALTDSDVASSTTVGTSESISLYTAAASGTHYIDVRIKSGEGTYTVEWHADNSTPTVQWLDSVAEFTDIAEMGVVASDTGGSGVRYIHSYLSSDGIDWWYFDSVEGASGVVWKDHPEDWYFAVEAEDGAGNLSDMVVRGPVRIWGTTALSLVRSSAYPAYGAPVTLTAQLTWPYGGAALQYGTVVFERLYGSTWYAVGSAITDYYGNARLSVRPYAYGRTSYRARFAGEGPWKASNSPVTVVTPKSYLPAPVAPTSAYRGRAFLVTGTLKPLHTAGTYPVRVYKFRYVSGRWVSYGYSSAKVDRYGRYVVALRLPYRGKWMLKAYHSDTLHYATYSGPDTIYIR